MSVSDGIQVNEVAARNKDREDANSDKNRLKELERLQRQRDREAAKLARLEGRTFGSPDLGPTERSIGIGDIALFNQGRSIRNISGALGNTTKELTPQQLAEKENKRNIQKTADGIAELNRKIGAAKVA